MRSDIDKKMLRLAVGGGNRGLVDNGKLAWDKLCKRLSHVTVTAEKFTEYSKMGQSARNDLKNVAGYWIGAHCEDGRRKASTIKTRDLVCFDIDSGNMYDGDIIKDLKEGNTPLSQYEFFCHSSRSHTPTNPKIRLVFPLAKPVKADTYAPLSRFLAAELDETMSVVDPVSFRVAQMMYLPSCSVDMEDSFVAFRNHGEMLNPRTFLESLDTDWQDFENWPRSDIEGNLRKSADKSEDPLEKKGIIGAFCRAYNIYDAIEKFIPDIYIDPLEQEGSEVRYQYAGPGSSGGGQGAIVYDDGLFMFSHHGSDPLAEQNVNAFDMVRAHKFFSLWEKEKDTDMAMTKRPSYKAMVEFLMDDPNVATERSASMIDPSLLLADLGQIEEEADRRTPQEVEMDTLLGDLGELPDEDEKDVLNKQTAERDWFGDLEMGEQGFKATNHNGAVIAINDPRFAKSLGFNELTEDVTVLRSFKPMIEHLPTMKLQNKKEGDRLVDKHINFFRTVLDSPAYPKSKGYGLKLGKNDAGNALYLAAIKNSYHPVRQYLESLKWDGKERVDTLWIDFLGVDDNIYHRETAALMLVGAVTRVYEPGHKFDTAVILEGLQGTRKSSMIKIFARGRWFTELDADLSDRKKTVEQMQGFWFVELPELSQFNKRDANEIKSFMSGTNDTVRMAYATQAETFRRQCVFVGSTNDAQYLPDQTGNRRFWPVAVKVTKIDTDRLDAEMDQIWAEAYHRYKEMRREHPKKHGELRLTLSDEAELIATEEQATRVRVSDEEVMMKRLLPHLDRAVPLSGVTYGSALGDLDDDTTVIRNVLTPAVAWTQVLGQDLSKLERSKLIVLGKALQLLPGWHKFGRIRNKKLFGHSDLETVYTRDGVDPREQPYTVVGDAEEAEDLLG